MAGLLRLKRGSRRRRGRSAGQAGDALGSAGSPLAELQIDRCEYVAVDAGSALLRLEARANGDELDLPAMTLVVRRTGGDDEQRALLAPPARVESEPVERWRLAYAVPTEAVEDAGAQFQLSDGDGAATALPAPTAVADLDPSPSPEDVADLRARLQRERGGRIRAEEQLGDNSQDLADARAVLAQLEQRCAISERNLADLRQKLLLVWTESGELRQLLDAREGTHETTKREVRRRRSAERELRVLLARQERDLTAARENVRRRCEELADELANREAGERLAQDELEEARARAVTLQDAARTALESFEQTRGEADQTRVLLEQLRAELADARGSAQAYQTELEHEVEELKTSEGKLRDELARTRDALESARSGRRGRLRNALREAEVERARLEAEVTGLLLRLADLEDTLVEAGRPAVA